MGPRAPLATTLRKTARITAAGVALAAAISLALRSSGVAPGDYRLVVRLGSAVLFLLASGSLWLLVEPTPVRRRAAIALASTVVVFAAFPLIDLLVTLLGFPRLALGPFRNLLEEVPGRLAPNTAVCFVLLGLALLLLDRPTRRGEHPAQFLCIATALLSLLTLIGYVYQFEPFYRVADYQPMPLSAAVALLMLSAAVVFSRPDLGLMRIVGSPTSGGLLVRWLPPAILGVPLLFGSLTLAGQRLGFYDLEFGVSIFVLLNTVFFSLLVLSTARFIDHADTRRTGAERELRLRAAQQAGVADLGQRALSGTDLPVLQREAVSLVRDGLDVDACELLELSHDGRALTCVADIGWHTAEPDSTPLPTTTETLPGYTLACRQPVVVEDLQRDSRFAAPVPGRLEAVVSGVSVIVHGRTGPTGVLAAYSRGPKTFARDDLLLLQNVAAVLATAADRKRADQALRLSEEKFASAFRSCPDSIIVSTLAEGRFVDFNDSFLRITGYTRGEVAGRTAAELGFWVDPDTWCRIGRQAREHGTVRDHETSFRTQSGEVRIGLVSAEALSISGEDCLLTVVHDISERKRAEGETQNANQKLARWVGELETRTREISLLNDMGDLLQSCLTAAEAHGIMTQYTQHLFPRDAGTICILNRVGELLEPVATWGDCPGAEILFGPNECWALRRGRLHRVTEPTSSLVCGHVARPHPPSYLCVPMMAQGEALGVLHLREAPEPTEATPEVLAHLAESRLRLATTVAEHIALALANLRLRETLQTQSIRDQLTGLFNRRYMEESLERELRRAARTRRSVGLVLIDLDHFKQVNDAHGHEAGDKLLRAVGHFFQSRTREEDIACRYGGEEFVFVLPEASLEATRQRAERLREEVKDLRVQHHGRQLGPVSVSVGVSVYPDHGSTAAALVSAADLALYQAKAEGRDRLVVGRLAD